MKKKQLLQAIKSLPMLKEDKEKFVNIILDNSGGGSQDDIRYYMANNMPNIENNDVSETMMSYVDSAVYDRYGYKGLMNYFMIDHDATNTIAISFNFSKITAGYSETSGIAIYNHFFDILNANGLSEYIEIINNTPTITKEEFINLVKQ